ncbi:MAG TPA: DNA mismatch repair endonuclease MutL [Dehalococcoidia bacterium]|nr:DNA mismatch repair endonuclease MutL [Dehalococcoidia bacterium]
MPIKVLAPEVISKIAAGEVIERPASVVKELVENSLDAGASQISVEAQGGGIDLIKVIDNGAGIPASEVELAFHRYATSKVSNLDDLGNISSLGFRGEALPSIAAVAEVEISTKASSDAVGSYMYLRKGDIVRQESHARPQGTTITVHRLFRYFPARLKFLKSANAENSHIAHVVSHHALAFPEVRFSLLLDKHLSLQTAGNGNLRDVVNQIYGLKLAQGMLKVKWRGTLSEISGLVSPPSLSRSNRSYLSLFVNRRWVYSSLLIRATEKAYHGLLMDGKHPVAIINISLPPEEIDVNVHPTKAQIRFHHEQAVFASVGEAAKGALTTAPIAKPGAIPPSTTSRQELASLRWQGQMVGEKEPAFTAPLPTPDLPVLRVMGQLANTYIIAEGPEGLYLIDQHAAHERILYDRILAQWSQAEVEVQGLLQPITIELTLGEEQTLEANKETLAQFGFTIEPFGDRSHLIRAVPAMITKANIIEAVHILLDNLASKDSPTPWEEKIAQSLACHSAIRGGQQLSDEEMRELIKQLEQTKQPRTCPHGRPTMIHLSSYQLEKEFGRVK